MLIKRCRCFYFSPTDNTKSVVEEIARSTKAEVMITDLTKPHVRNQDAEEFVDGDIAVIGVPVYGGIMPQIALEYIKKIKAHNVPLIAVVTYGNRDYINGLYELKNVCGNAGFITVAGGAFIGEHSWSSDKKPIAQNRPDKKDLQKAYEFGMKAVDKIESTKNINEIALDRVSFNKNYKAIPMPAVSPKTDMSKCTMCNLCVNSCPTNAIEEIDGALISDKKKCIACYKCIKNCPQGAIEMKNVLFKLLETALHATCKQRREPELFLD